MAVGIRAGFSLIGNIASGGEEVGAFLKCDDVDEAGYGFAHALDGSLGGGGNDDDAATPGIGDATDTVDQGYGVATASLLVMIKNFSILSIIQFLISMMDLLRFHLLLLKA